MVKIHHISPLPPKINFPPASIVWNIKAKKVPALKKDLRVGTWFLFRLYLKLFSTFCMNENLFFKFAMNKNLF